MLRLVQSRADGTETGVKLVAFCLASLVVLTSAACSKQTPEPSPTASSASVSSAASAPVPTTEPLGSALPPVDPAQASIPDRFAAEAMKRPTGVPRIEDAFDAFKKAGIELREEKQHLGSPFLAIYCVGFQTGNDVHASICEYKDEATATKGRDTSDKSFSTVPNRKVYRNGGSTLTVRVGVVTPANDALVKKMLATFQALKPSTTPPPVGKAPSPFAGASVQPMPPDPPPP